MLSDGATSANSVFEDNIYDGTVLTSSGTKFCIQYISVEVANSYMPQITRPVRDILLQAGIPTLPEMAYVI